MKRHTKAILVQFDNEEVDSIIKMRVIVKIRQAKIVVLKYVKTSQALIMILNSTEISALEN